MVLYDEVGGGAEWMVGLPESARADEVVINDGLDGFCLCIVIVFRKLPISIGYLKSFQNNSVMIWRYQDFVSTE